MGTRLAARTAQAPLVMSACCMQRRAVQLDASQSGMGTLVGTIVLASVVGSKLWTIKLSPISFAAEETVYQP